MRKSLLLSLFLTGAIGTQAQVTSGLVSRYNFTNGSAFDQAGNNHGTVIGATPTTDRFGIANMAYSFDGSSNYIAIQESATNSLNTMNDITISAWIKPNSLGAGLHAIVAKWNGSSSEQYALFTNGANNTVAVRTVNNSGQTDAAGYTAGNWYHVVFSFNKTTNQHLVYVNGVMTLNFSPAGTYANSTDTTSLSIGAELNDLNGSMGSPNRFFDGAIDDISIYDRVLSSTEIDSLYNAEAPVCNGFNVAVIQNNPSSGSDGSILFNVEGGLAPYTYTVNGGSTQNMTSSSVCGYASEGNIVAMSAPSPAVFTAVNFASYGSSTGSCGNYLISTCHAQTSWSVAADSLVGNTSGNIHANNGVFGDPCFGTGKYMNIQASYAENVTLSSLAPGNYTIVVTDSVGCTTTSTITVASAVGLFETQQNNGITVYPNPANATITISASLVTTATIYDATGRVAMTQSLNGQTTIDISTLEKGVYFISTPFTKSCRFVKQ